MTIALIALLTGGLLVGGISAPATADPGPLVPNAAGRFAINVPGSVLTAAAPDGATAAQLAAADQFDWAFTDPAYAAVSGTLTGAPAVETTVLTATEAATFDALVANFAAPAAAATATTVAATGGVAIAGFGLGLMVGRSAARIAGFSDDQVCIQHDAVEAALASVLDGVDCSAYQNQLTAIQRDADQVPVTSIAPITLDGLTMTYVHGDPWPGLAYNLLTCFNVTGTRQPGTSLSVHVTGANGSSNYTGSYEANSYCGSDSNLSGWWVTAPMLTAQLTVYGPGINDTSAVVSGTVTVPDPARQFQCVIHTFEGGTYTALSSTFQESDAQLAGVVRPSIAAGETPHTYQITEIGGGTSHVLLDQSVTGAFANWSANFPECRNGSCLLDLRHDNQSCFLTPDASACDGWIDHQPNYDCYVGTHQVALSECYVYALAFNPSHIASGTAYADPSDGSSISTPTSPSDTDVVTNALISGGWISAGPTDLGRRMGDALLGPDIGTAARRVAVACVAIAWRDDCKSRPIFAPGDNVGGAAVHDRDAIIGLGFTAPVPQPALLVYTTPSAGSWYTNTPPCKTGTYDPAGEECDEYPFATTTAAGSGGSIRLVSRLDNQAEGYYLNRFYTLCGIPTKVDKSFLTVPVVLSGDSSEPVSFTSAWCGTAG